jgi:hypothetical protein
MEAEFFHVDRRAGVRDQANDLFSQLCKKHMGRSGTVKHSVWRYLISSYVC